MAKVRRIRTLFGKNGIVVSSSPSLSSNACFTEETIFFALSAKGGRRLCITVTSIGYLLTISSVLKLLNNQIELSLKSLCIKEYLPILLLDEAQDS